MDPIMKFDGKNYWATAAGDVKGRSREGLGGGCSPPSKQPRPATHPQTVDSMHEYKTRGRLRDNYRMVEPPRKKFKESTFLQENHQVLLLAKQILLSDNKSDNSCTFDEDILLPVSKAV